MTEIVCAIHQPNFFPWMGYFDKIAKSDVFVFLDDVQRSKGDWTNRVRLPSQKGSTWATCPVRRSDSLLSIQNVGINDERPWRKKFLRTLETNYGKAPGFKVAFTVIEELLSSPEKSLAAFNIRNIKRLCNLLGIEAEFVLQSSLDTSKHSTDLLIEIVSKVNATAYLCGAGAAGYQDDAMFARSGLGLIYQNFNEKPSGEMGTWQPGLSVIDRLMRMPPVEWQGLV